MFSKTSINMVPLNAGVGGGTLIPWAVIPAAAICEVDPFELTKRSFVPVVVGLIVTTIVAMFIM